MNPKWYRVRAYTLLVFGVAWAFTPWKEAVVAVWLLSIFTQYSTDIGNWKAAEAKEAAQHADQRRP